MPSKCALWQVQSLLPCQRAVGIRPALKQTAGLSGPDEAGDPGALGVTRFERHEVTMQDIASILEAYGRETGLGLGEDSASTR